MKETLISVLFSLSMPNPGLFEEELVYFSGNTQELSSEYVYGRNYLLLGRKTPYLLQAAEKIRLGKGEFREDCSSIDVIPENHIYYPFKKLSLQTADSVLVQDGIISSQEADMYLKYYYSKALETCVANSKELKI